VPRNTFRVAAYALTFLGLVAVPAVAGAEEIADYTGAQLFQRFCASCHGKAGEGDGPVASSLKTMVPDLTRISKRRGGQYPQDLVRRIIDGTDVRSPHGSRDMPVWGQEFWQAQGADAKARQQTIQMIDRLVEYVGTIQR
jgi:mono/diheme cytochrome c family protein